MHWLAEIWNGLLATALDVAPIAAVLLGFQLGVLRQRLPNPGRIALGFVCAVAGLGLFLVGLE